MSEEAIAIFKADKCPNCETALKDAEEILDDEVELVEIDVSENEDALEFVKKYGFEKVPLTIAGEIEDDEFKPSASHFEGRDRLKLKKWRQFIKK